MDGNALEVALALWRIPSMRWSLRQRPLPDDVGEVIELATGAPERLAKAAARTDEPPAQVLEAARFYVREVLLCAGSDAYRVLGVSHDAAPEQIKAHHRALQHWLHPDRRGDDWESVYAARINTAWGELRSPQRRAAYDARKAQVQVSAEVESTPRRVLVTDWRAAPGNETRWRGWLALAAAVAGCIWLAVLVDRQAGAPVPEWNAASDETPDTGPTPLQPTLAAPVERPGRMPRPAEGSDALATSAQKLTAAPAAAASFPAIAVPVASVSEPAKVLPVPPANVTAKTRLAPVTASVPDAMASEDMSVSLAATEPRVVRHQAPVLVVPAPTEPVSARPAQLGHAHVAAPVTDIDLLERARLAHHRGRDVTRYLTGRSNHVPPIWHSVAAQDAAASIRDRLDGGRTPIARIVSRMRLGDPAWRIATDRATMTSTIERGGSEAGATTLRVELAWRDGMWLVDTIETDNLQ